MPARNPRKHSTNRSKQLPLPLRYRKKKQQTTSYRMRKGKIHIGEKAAELVCSPNMRNIRIMIGETRIATSLIATTLEKIDERVEFSRRLGISETELSGLIVMGITVNKAYRGFKLQRFIISEAVKIAKRAKKRFVFVRCYKTDTELRECLRSRRFKRVPNSVTWWYREL